MSTIATRTPLAHSLSPVRSEPPGPGGYALNRVSRPPDWPSRIVTTGPPVAVYVARGHPDAAGRSPRTGRQPIAIGVPKRQDRVDGASGGPLANGQRLSLGQRDLKRVAVTRVIDQQRDRTGGETDGAGEQADVPRVEPDRWCVERQRLVRQDFVRAQVQASGRCPEVFGQPRDLSVDGPEFRMAMKQWDRAEAGIEVRVREARGHDLAAFSVAVQRVAQA